MIPNEYNVFSKKEQRFVTSYIFPNCIIDTEKNKIFSVKQICKILNEEFNKKQC